MIHRFTRIIGVVSMAMMALLALHPALAQTDGAYPSRPVRMIVPFPPSGSTDILARLVAELLAKDLGQPFVVLNVGGAGGTIGATQVARAPGDGYTLLMGTPSTIINNPNLNPAIGYDPLKDFQAVTFLWAQPVVVLVSKDSPFKTLKDLIAEAKRQPGKLNYGSNGVGGFNHLAGELFNSLAGIKITHIPYKGAAPAMADLMAGTVDLVFGTVAGLTSASDRLNGLAVGASKRSAFIPSVPSAPEAGLPDYLYSSWGGLFTTAGTPPRATERLNASIDKGLKVQSIKDRFVAAGVDAVTSTPAELQRHIANEYRQVKQLIETVGIKL